MRITKQDLDDAVKADVVRPDTAEKLLAFLTARSEMAGPSRFDLTNLLWYSGVLTVIAAMALFLAEASSRWDSLGVAATALVSAAVFVAAGDYFWRVRQLRILGGLLLTLAVAMAPLATLGLQDHFDWWPFDDPRHDWNTILQPEGSRLILSLSAIFAALVLLKVYTIPFMAMVIACALWALSMDLAPWFLPEPPAFSDDGSIDVAASNQYRFELAELRGIVSTLFGVFILLIYGVLDRRRPSRFGFWAHLAAGLSILVGCYFWLIDDGVDWAILCAVGIALVLISLPLQRRSYAVFGGVAVASYLVYLSFEIVDDFLILPFALTGIGMVILAIGYLVFRRRRVRSASTDR